MRRNSWKGRIVPLVLTAAFALASANAQAGHQLSTGESLWMRTSMMAPSDFDSMTFFSHIHALSESTTIQYVVYRPAEKFGQVLHPLGMDFDPFRGDVVIVEFKVLQGSVEFQDTVWVWDGTKQGGMQAWVAYPFFFGFYAAPPPWSVVAYVPGEILENPPPHGDPIVVYGPWKLWPTGGSNFRSDFLKAVEVPLDIKPLSCPNSINTSSLGRTPVALLGTAGFDVSTVALDTIRLEGIAPVRFAYSDVAAPMEVDNGTGGCGQCAVLPGEGYGDLVMHFDTQAIADYLNHSGTEECRILVLTGQKTDGSRFIARDVVRIVR